MNGSQIVGAFGVLIGLAMVAVLVSQNAQTANVIQAIGGAVGQSIGAATAPVTNAGGFGG